MRAQTSQCCPQLWDWPKLITLSFKVRGGRESKQRHSLVSLKISALSILLFLSLFERERERECMQTKTYKQGELQKEEGEADSPLSREPDAHGSLLYLRTLRS